MNKNKYNLDNFKKNGFFVIKKLLTKKEIKEMEKSFKKKENDSGYNEINDRNCRNYLTNKNLNLHKLFFFQVKQLQNDNL